MIDNFDLIASLMKFNNPDDFYFVQVIQRKKDHAEENKRLGRNNNARLIKAFYIYSVEQLQEYRSEIIELCKLFNARGGVNLNIRNSKRVALEMMEQLAHCIKSGNYNVAKLYNSCCGMVSALDRLWVVDVDMPSIPVGDGEHVISIGFETYISNVAEAIAKVEPLDITKIIARIPTKNGIHLITKPFNSKAFGEKFPDIEIHKNNPTCLFIP